jgi:WXG100 family type VII secretion target
MSIAFDSGQHETLLERLHAATLEIQRQLDELEDAVTEVRGGWSGAARAACDDAQNRWSTAMRAMHSILNQADEAAATAGETLRAAEATAIRLWS